MKIEQKGFGGLRCREGECAGFGGRGAITRIERAGVEFGRASGHLEPEGMACGQFMAGALARLEVEAVN